MKGVQKMPTPASWVPMLNVACSFRYIMVIKLSDPSGEAWVSVFNEHAERIIGCSADELDQIRKEVTSAIFVCESSAKRIDMIIVC
jgi:hypothetical protein